MKKNSPFRQVVKPVITTSAQSAVLCADCNDSELQESELVVSNFVSKHESDYLGAIVGLLLDYGLRISEVLSLSGESVMSNGALLIKGAKGSESRIVMPIHGRLFWQSLKGYNLPISSIYSRFHIYRVLKAHGVYGYFGVNHKASVTHYMRHLKVLSLKESGLSAAEISRFIGHKNLNSIRYYEKKQRE